MTAKGAKANRPGKGTTPTVAESTNAEPVTPSLAAIDALDVDTLVLCLTPSMRPLPGAAGFTDWRLCGELSRLLRADIVTGATDEKVLLPGAAIGVDRILALGFGDDIRKDSEAKIAWLVKTVNALGAERIAIAPPEPGKDWIANAKVQFEKAFGDRLVALFVPET